MSLMPRRPAPGAYLRRGRSTYLHRLIMPVSQGTLAELLGRPLSGLEVVHHEDGDPQNNLPSNLRVFAHGGQHSRYHAYRRREQRGVVHLFEVEVFL